MPIIVRDRRGGHWSWFHHAIIDDYGAALGPYGIAVYVCLCRHADREETTFVGQRTIATEIGSGRTSVNQAVAKLRALGLVEVEDRVDEHGRTTSTYTLLEVTPVHGANSRDAPAAAPMPARQTANQFMNKNHPTRDTDAYTSGRWGWKVQQSTEQLDAAERRE